MQIFKLAYIWNWLIQTQTQTFYWTTMKSGFAKCKHIISTHIDTKWNEMRWEQYVYIYVLVRTYIHMNTHAHTFADTRIHKLHIYIYIYIYKAAAFVRLYPSWTHFMRNPEESRTKLAKYTVHPGKIAHGLRVIVVSDTRGSFYNHGLIQISTRISDPMFNKM